MRKSKRTRVSRTILKMTNKTEGMTLPGFKIYITVIIKTIVLTEGDMQVDKKENSETDKYTQVTFEKQKNNSMLERVFSTNGSGANDHRQAKNKTYKKPQPTSQLHIKKTNSRWIMDFNILCKTIKLIERKMQEKIFQI